MGGGVNLPQLTNQATANDIINGKQIIDSNGNVLIGDMTVNNGFITPLRCGESKLIKGHIEPSSSVVAITLDQQTYGNANPNHIWFGDTAWVKGNKITGILGVNNVTNFTANLFGGNQIRLGWNNPAGIVSGKGITGVFINYSTSGYPGPNSGTRIYTGNGGNTSLNGQCQAVVNMPTAGTTYYYTLTTYLSTSVGDIWGSSYNITARTQNAELNLTYDFRFGNHKDERLVYVVPDGYTKLDITYSNYDNLSHTTIYYPITQIPISVGYEIVLYKQSSLQISVNRIKKIVTQDIFMIYLRLYN